MLLKKLTQSQYNSNQMWNMQYLTSVLTIRPTWCSLTTNLIALSTLSVRCDMTAYCAKFISRKWKQKWLMDCNSQTMKLKKNHFDFFSFPLLEMKQQCPLLAVTKFRKCFQVSIFQMFLAQKMIDHKLPIAKAIIKSFKSISTLFTTNFHWLSFFCYQYPKTSKLTCILCLRSGLGNRIAVLSPNLARFSKIAAPCISLLGFSAQNDSNKDQKIKIQSMKALASLLGVIILAFYRTKRKQK